MGTAGKMARAQEAVEKAATLAEAKAALADVLELQEETTDIFYTQQQAFDTLVDVLQQQSIEQPVYVSSVAQPTKTPNYLLYIGGAVLLFLLFKK